MKIAQISDTHILVPESENPAGRSRAENLRRCIAHINRQAPDLVIHSGDTVQHGQAAEYAHLRELLAPLEAPLYVIPGNRDDRAALREAFGDQAYLPVSKDFFHYAVELPPLRLVALDSTAPGERKGVYCEARQAWLDGELARAPETPTLLFIHHPPFDIDDHYIGGYRRQPEAEALAAVVARHPQVTALICGHVHCPTRRAWAGATAVTMPSVAVDVRKGIDETEARQRPIYNLHEISTDGSIVTTPQRVDDP